MGATFFSIIHEISSFEEEFFRLLFILFFSNLKSTKLLLSQEVIKII